MYVGLYVYMCVCTDVRVCVYVYCGGAMHLPKHSCGGPRTACRSWFLPSSTCSRDRTQVINRLASQCLHLSAFAGPGDCIFINAVAIPSKQREAEELSKLLPHLNRVSPLADEHMALRVSHYSPLVGLEFAMQTRLASGSQRVSCLCSATCIHLDISSFTLYVVYLKSGEHGC